MYKRQAKDSPQEEAYLRARKSLHVWPIENSTVEGLLEFAKKFLMMTNEEFATFGVVSVDPCRRVPQSKVQREHCVLFTSISDRDSFRAYAPKLQPFQRSAGMRLSLPDHLMSTFKMLENEGFRIVRRRPGTKRNIKFDDMVRSLVMDVKLPGAAWVRISPEQVRRAASARQVETTPDVSDVLAISAMDLPVAPPAPPTVAPSVALPVVQEEDDEMQEHPDQE